MWPLPQWLKCREREKILPVVYVRSCRATLSQETTLKHTRATQGARQIHSTAFYPSVGGKVWDTVTGKSGWIRVRMKTTSCSCFTSERKKLEKITASLKLRRTAGLKVTCGWVWTTMLFLHKNKMIFYSQNPYLLYTWLLTAFKTYLH